MKALSFLAAGIAVIALPLASGRPQLGLQAAVIVALFAVVAFLVRGVRAQRDTLRQGNVDVGTLKRVIRTLDELIAAIETPVLGASAERAQFVDAGTAIHILTRHRFTSIPTPSSDVEVVARIGVLCQDDEFMSLLRSTAARSRRRWQQHMLHHGSRLTHYVPESQAIEAYLVELEAAEDGEQLVAQYWPGLTSMRTMREGLQAQLPS